MIGIIVTGHGSFASGLKSSVELIAGVQSNVSYVDFTAGMNTDDIKQALNESVESMGSLDQIMILSDIKGGSPFKAGLEIAMSKENITLFGGTNLPLLLECSLSRYGADDFEVFVNTVEKLGAEGLSRFEMNYDDDDED